MIKLKDIYALKGLPVDLTHAGLRADWFPEIASLMQDIWGVTEQLEADKRLVLKNLVSKNYDGDRIAEMHTIWFDGKPVAIVQNAGRGGDDHQQRWVTDIAAYRAVLAYLVPLLLGSEAVPSDPEAEVYEEELCRFYGTDFSADLGFQCEPRREDVMLIGLDRGVLDGEVPGAVLAFLQVGAPDVPEYIRRGPAAFRQARLIPLQELEQRNPLIVRGNEADGRDRTYLYEPCARPVGIAVLSV